MPLLEIFHSNPSAIEQFSIDQVVATAGDGNLKDGSDCSSELRAFLSEVPSAKLKAYIERCLASPLNKGGMILQDLINELGRRLEYKVKNGLYQGSPKKIGFDGLWTSIEGHSIILEVKTTDAYRISLETIVSYREKLRAANEISEPSSILVVVGREDTGELEAQIRGSRHAWDVRLISADALLKLVELKEDSDAPETGKKIRSLLTPMEYTRLDDMIEVMFATTKDVVNAAEVDAPVAESESPKKDPNPSGWEFTDSVLLQEKREKIVHALGRREVTGLIKKSRALYWSADHKVRAVCTISKRYATRHHPYWYAYHPRWDDFLKEGEKSFVVFGCMDKSSAYVLPADILRGYLADLRTTDERYWHVDLTDTANGKIGLYLAKSKKIVDLAQFELKFA